MEKLTPHYHLKRIQSMLVKGEYTITRTALNTASQHFGLDEEGIIAVIRSLTNKNFYKSMTSHDNHTLWQDVYKKVMSPISGYYIKVQISDDDAVIISFKEDKGHKNN